ncbi:AraC family transcriptional regulator [Roseiarcus fermentans]|uniref:AraC family transcriptional regulator n=1 Tax=Roseiarcus fermentans TaxID=1473586 RepID=A0A366EP66_9HYPH|nr:AraC family transcriptional regulator [Roseiarcus fermentans]RBP03279.1 AraC family transcriptional regulator [Roseiarcus fermentans]
MSELGARSESRKSGSNGSDAPLVIRQSAEPSPRRAPRSIPNAPWRGHACPTTIGLCARQVVASLKEKRIDPAPLLARAGLESMALDSRGARVSAAAEANLIEFAAEAAADPTFGLNLGASESSDQAGLVSLVLSTTSCVRETIRLLPRYGRIVDESARFSVAFPSSQNAVIELRYSGQLRRNLKHAAEYQVAAFVRALRDFTGHDFSPVRVSFAHMRRDDARAFERFFRCPVEFGCEVDQLVLSKDTLDLPNRRADRYLLQTLQPFADEETAARELPSQSFCEAVDNQVFRTLARGEPTVEIVSQALAVSPRTLSRRLAEEGTTFPELLTNLRRSLALQYIQEPGLSIDQIALLLGYSEVASFSHAFRRWFGHSPSAARRAPAPVRVEQDRPSRVILLN